MNSSAKESLITAFLSDHPQSAAKVLIKSRPSELAEFVKKYPSEVMTSSLGAVPVKVLSEIFEMLEDEYVAKLIQHFSPNLASNIMRQWTALGKKERVDSVLKLVDLKVSRPIRSLLDYPSGSVGSLMNTVPLSVPANLTVREVINLLKKEKNNYSRYIYVTDAESSLIGVLPFKETYYSNKEEVISGLMTASVFALEPEMSVGQALENTAWKNWDSLPVATTKGILLGVIRYEDLEKNSSRGKKQGAASEELIQASAAVGEVFQIGLSATMASLGISVKR